MASLGARFCLHLSHAFAVDHGADSAITTLRLLRLPSAPPAMWTLFRSQVAPAHPFPCEHHTHHCATLLSRQNLIALFCILCSLSHIFHTHYTSGGRLISQALRDPARHDDTARAARGGGVRSVCRSRRAARVRVEFYVSVGIIMLEWLATRSLATS